MICINFKFSSIFLKTLNASRIGKRVKFPLTQIGVLALVSWMDWPLIVCEEKNVCFFSGINALIQSTHSAQMKEWRFPVFSSSDSSVTGFNNIVYYWPNQKTSLFCEGVRIKTGISCSEPEVSGYPKPLS